VRDVREPAGHGLGVTCDALVAGVREAGLLVAGALAAGLLVAGLPVGGVPVDGLLVSGAEVTGLDGLDGDGLDGDGLDGSGGSDGSSVLDEPGVLEGPGADVAGALLDPGLPVVREPVASGAVPDGAALLDVGGWAVLDGEEPPEVPVPLAGGEDGPPDAGGEDAFPLSGGVEGGAPPPFPGAVVPPDGGGVDVAALVPPPGPSVVAVSTASVTYCPNVSSVPGAGSEPVTTASSGGAPFPA
jgi:hypothetical protein